MWILFSMLINTRKGEKFFSSSTRSQEKQKIPHLKVSFGTVIFFFSQKNFPSILLFENVMHAYVVLIKSTHTVSLKPLPCPPITFTSHLHMLFFLSTLSPLSVSWMCMGLHGQQPIGSISLKKTDTHLPLVASSCQ